MQEQSSTPLQLKKLQEGGFKEEPLEVDSFWNRSLWVQMGVFFGVAGALTLPWGGGTSGVLLTLCCLAYLAHHLVSKFSKCLSKVRDPCHIPQDLARRPMSRVTLSSLEWWFLGVMVLYPILVTLNILFLVNPILPRYFDRPSHFLLIPPLYFAIRHSGITSKPLVQGAIVGSLGAGLIAIYQWAALGVVRPGGWSNPVSFSAVALILVCISLVPLSLPRFWNSIRWLSALLGITAVFLANTRGTFIAIPFLAWMLIRWSLKEHPHRLKWSFLAPVVTVIVLILAPYSQQRLVRSTASEVASLFSGSNSNLMSQFISKELFSKWYFFEGYPKGHSKEYSEDFVPEQSISERWERLRVAWVLFAKNPWWGVGYGQYLSQANELRSQGFIKSPWVSNHHAHNNYLHLAAEMGMMGIFVYLLQLFFIYMMGHHSQRHFSRGLGPMLKVFVVGQGIYSLSDAQFSNTLTSSFFIVMTSTLVAVTFNEIFNEI